MCHQIIAERICQVCQRSQGEFVIDFAQCARKCSSPFYCLTPKPQMEVCALCAAKLPTPVLARQVAEDMAAARMVPRSAALQLPVGAGGDGPTPGGGPPRHPVLPGPNPGRQHVCG